MIINSDDATSYTTLTDVTEEAIAAAGAPMGQVWYEWPREFMRLLIANDQARGRATAAEAAARVQMVETARGFQNLGLSMRDIS